MATVRKTPKAPAAKMAAPKPIAKTEAAIAPPPVAKAIKALAAPAVKVEKAFAEPVAKVEKIMASPAAPPAAKVEAAAEVSTKVYAEIIKSIVKRPRLGFADYEEFMQMSKDNLDALLKSSSIMAKGVQDMTASLASMARESIEDSATASKALMGAKSVKEVIDLSSSLTKASIDKIVSESTKLSQISTRLTQSALDPFNKRVTVVVDRLTRKAA